MHKIAILISIIGFSSCSKEEIPEEPEIITWEGFPIECNLAEYLAGDFIGTLHYFSISPDTLDTMYVDTVITAINMSTDFTCLLNFNGIVRNSVYVADNIDSITGTAGVSFNGDSMHYYFFQNPWIPAYPNQPSYNQILRIEYFGVTLN